MYRVVYLFFLIGLVACSNTGNKELESAAENASRFKMTLGAGGGFTGLYKGYNLYEDGRVEAWQQRSGRGDSLLWQSVIGAAAVEGIREGLLESGALSKRYDTAGNMTAVVTFDTADTTYRWSWDKTRQGPIELDAWYEETRAFCAQSAP